ncbi:MAG TPA: peptidase S10, partial [Solibacterales bacterium]|nr:peptidase S10 [Bryobacterales bacterium]
EIEAQMFYIAYVADREPSAPPRPLMFSFNGGPGSSSVWLHLGVIGPKRVKMQDDG